MNVRIGILTVSDRVSTGDMEDTGRVEIERALANPQWQVEQRAVLPDELDQIEDMLRRWSDDTKLDVIFTTGGTGLGPRDVTPEATVRVATRLIPGMSEAMRRAGLRQTEHAMLSRATAALRNHTLIINLPGSPKGAREGVEAVRGVIEHAIATVHGGRH